MTGAFRRQSHLSDSGVSILVLTRKRQQLQENLKISLKAIVEIKLKPCQKCKEV